MLQASQARLRLVVIVTTVVAAGGAATLPAIATGVIYREWADTGALAATLIFGGLVGLAGRRFVGTAIPFTSREGFAAVALSWLVLILFGTLP